MSHVHGMSHVHDMSHVLYVTCGMLRSPSILTFNLSLAMAVTGDRTEGGREGRMITEEGGRGGG